MSAASSCLDSLRRGGVCAYVGHAIAFAGDASRISRALSWMTPAERDRYANFRHDRDRWMFGLGREMARSLVGAALDVPPEAWIWREGPHGRPEIASPASGLHFNLSHSAGLVVCALSRDRAVGVDVEDLTRRAPDVSIVSRYCSPAEAEDVFARADDWCDRFLTYWTLKEAYLKATGLGISVHLSDISFTVDGGGQPRIRFLDSLAGTDDRWRFHLLRLEPHHLAAVAVETRDGASPAFALQPY
jgi:4'-phosphopantetheinyl transferase